MTERRACYLYLSPRLDGIAEFSTAALDDTTERHHLVLDTGPPKAVGHPVEAIRRRRDCDGIVVGLTGGVPNGRQLDLLAMALRRGLRAWLYWPDERAVECVDRERLRSLRRHRRAVIVLERIGRHVHRLMTCWGRIRPGLRWIYYGAFPVQRRALLAELLRIIPEARAVPFRRSTSLSHPSRTIDAGLYLRTDFWAAIVSGGSYGHTCYVAKELARVTDRFVCLLAQPFTLLDDLGVTQVVMQAPAAMLDEDAIASATARYYPIVRAVCEGLRPSYIYERLCLGNYVGAVVSRELQIPYIIEYNGSPISMQRSPVKSTFVYDDLYVKAEEMAFRQASLISVISERVKTDLLSRGFDARKILVNPNGADPDSYAPVEGEARRHLRTRLGFTDSDRVIGFTGTFNGWHGTDVLAAGLPRICAADANARFLIIGDGEHKPQLDREIERHQLEGRVKRVGCVPQADGARLLQACDIFVAPHNTHLIGGRFFGSPTKIFEYMSLGGGIVASDLEQIGEVLSPALRVEHLARADLTIGDQRSVLCVPGDVDEFVAGVVELVRRPDIARALGRNARRAVVAQYSWRRHVERLWNFADALSQGSDTGTEETETAGTPPRHRRSVRSPDCDTSEITPPPSLEWFLEIERERYRTYAPWMPALMEFDAHAGGQILQVGGGIGTDLAQFATHGARVTDLDSSATQLQLARQNFKLRGLIGRFVHHDVESLPFDDDTFDAVYAIGVIHHTPNTARVVSEIRRVLKPGGRVIVMVYAESSLHYWRALVWRRGLKGGGLASRSMGDITSRMVESSGPGVPPLVKVYTRARLRALFRDFDHVRIVQRQLDPELWPARLHWLRPVVERLAGWHLIVKGSKPAHR